VQTILEGRDVIIDAHSHLFPPSWKTADPVPADLFILDRIFERQAEAGIDLTVISDPHIWYGSRDLGEANSSREYNDFVAGLCRDYPRQIGGLGSVTPWRGSAHMAEASRAITELGLSGLAISTRDRGKYLDAVPEEFWQLVEELRAPVFIHPGTDVLGQDVMRDYRLGELCGRPLDMTATLSRFILTGGFERHPDVQLLCAHAGGAITAIADRLDFGHELRRAQQFGPWGPVELSRPPSTFVAQLYLDTVTFGARPLRLALDTVGGKQLCFGTDGPPVPFPASRHRAVVADLRLSAEMTADIMGNNAAGLFSIRLPAVPS